MAQTWYHNLNPNFILSFDDPCVYLIDHFCMSISMKKSSTTLFIIAKKEDESIKPYLQDSMKTVKLYNIIFIKACFFFFCMHECVNIYFSNKNKNYVHKSHIFKNKHHFFVNGLIDEFSIFRDGHQTFWMV